VTDDDRVTMPLRDLRQIEDALKFAEVHHASPAPVREAALAALITLRKAWQRADAEAAR